MKINKNNFDFSVIIKNCSVLIKFAYHRKNHLQYKKA